MAANHHNHHHHHHPPPLPRNQNALLLLGPQQPYRLVQDHALPEIVRDDELLVRTQVVGLNPVDWKSPDFNFGIPSLPFISGREQVGVVVKPPKSITNNRFQEGDQIIVISTDYRDLRKGSFQDYVVASEFNALKLPPHINVHKGACFGVPFVAAALSLGICFGLDFSAVESGPDLLRMVREELDAEKDLPPDDEDVRRECLGGIEMGERAGKGDWVAIWGGSSATAGIVTQLARLAGMHVLLAIDQAKHGLRIVRSQSLRPDILVDSHGDGERASAVIRDTIGNDCRFALDTQGRNSAEMLAKALVGSTTTTTPTTTTQQQDPVTVSPPSSPGQDKEDQPAKSSSTERRHVVGLSGLPKSAGVGAAGVAYHSVPIKLFHEVPQIGHALSTWLERLLHAGALVPPDVLVVEEGYEGVNRGLDKMRRNEVSGGRAVVDLRFGA